MLVMLGGHRRFILGAGEQTGFRDLDGGSAGLRVGIAKVADHGARWGVKIDADQVKVQNIAYLVYLVLHIPKNMFRGVTTAEGLEIATQIDGVGICQHL